MPCCFAINLTMLSIASNNGNDKTMVNQIDQDNIKSISMSIDIKTNSSKISNQFIHKW